MGATVVVGEPVFKNFVLYILSPIYQFVAVIAFLYFLYGVFRFIVDLNEPDKKSVGKSHLLWGLVGLFIIFSIGGILPLLNKIIGGMFTY